MAGGDGTGGGGADVGQKAVVEEEGFHPIGQEAGAVEIDVVPQGQDRDEDAGVCLEVEIGVESGSQAVLDRYGKGLSVETSIKALDLTVLHYFVIH